jgi:hypothetical protein
METIKTVLTSNSTVVHESPDARRDPRRAKEPVAPATARTAIIEKTLDTLKHLRLRCLAPKVASNARPKCAGIWRITSDLLADVR